MGLFSNLEDSLERYIEGFFKDKFSGRVQPVEIAKKLAREMRDRKRVSVANVYVPNEYTVFLHPEDCEAISSFSPLLANELSDYLVKKAAEKKFTLAAKPKILLQPDEMVGVGNLKVESKFGVALPAEKPLPEPLPAEAPEDVREHTQYFTPVRGDTAPVPGLPRTVSAVLYVESGPDAGKTFPLETYRMVIGRRETCDIVFNDPSISRRHAQLDYAAGRHMLSDLDSTNGTAVNGNPVEKVDLNPGDVVTMGTTVWVYKVN